MTTFDDRVQAVRALAKSTGKPVDAVLGAAAESWGLSAFELGELRATLHRDSGPDPKVSLAARAAADTTQTNAATERHTADVLAFRNFRTADPFTRARMLENGEAAAIERGRALDAPPDDGPQAA